MFQRHLKKLRVVIGLLFFLFTAFLFLDFRNILTSAQFKGILFLQFVPSLIKFVNLLSLASAGFIIILLLTALFGRVYCSAICPLGIFQDMVSFVSRIFRKKKKSFRFSQPWTKLRYTILAITVLSLLAGSTFVLGLLDPYSNFGRFVSDFVRPLFIKLNNGIASILEKRDIFFLYPVDLVKVNLLTFIFPALMLILVVALSFGRGRLYCNTVCPVGSLLGLLSKFSFFKIKINTTRCTQCGKCSKVCKSECINIKDQSVDFSRCVDCFNCLAACPENAIRLNLVPHKAIAVAPEVETTGNERRAFLAKSLALTVGAAGLSSLAFSQSKAETAVKKNVVCPPGSKGIKHFTDTCTSCHLCVSACPTKVLQPAFMEYGILGMMQPRMDYSTSFCNYDCTLCSEVCPTGAIQQLTKEVKQQTQIGVAHFTVTNCIVFRDNTSCGACSEHCPTKAVNMVPYKGELTIPEVNPKICIGCGGCEYACPARPEKAIRVIGHELHQKAFKPKVEKLKPVDTSQDFPF